LTDAVNLLGIVCAQFSKIYVCLDALDELGNLRGLLKQLRDSPHSMQIFITGRDYVQVTVQEYLTEGQTISIEAYKSDIQRFIEHEIGGPNDIEPRAMDERLRKDILEKVVNSAEGVLVYYAQHYLPH
jgi:S-methylmethionine-dependent homocysteine/selenocysteine methylase